MTAWTPFARMFANVIGGPAGVFLPRRASSRDRPRAMDHVLTSPPASAQCPADAVRYVTAVTAIALMSCSILQKGEKVMASVITAHPSIRKRSNQSFVYEPASEWRALLATFIAVSAAFWAAILLFALL
jgi:hypothetical protein